MVYTTNTATAYQLGDIQNDAAAVICNGVTKKLRGRNGPPWSTKKIASFDTLRISPHLVAVRAWSCLMYGSKAISANLAGSPMANHMIHPSKCLKLSRFDHCIAIFQLYVHPRVSS